MKTKNNRWLNEVNQELENILGDTLQHMGSDNPTTQK